MIRMAFFLTMPISRNTPISAMIENSMLEHQQRQHRADAGRGQRRQHRDRVHQAFVQDAQHDVDHDDGGQDQQRLLLVRFLRRARPCPGSCRARWSACRWRPRPARTAAWRRDSESPVGQVERDGGGQLAVLVVDRARRSSRSAKLRDGRQRHHGAAPRCSAREPVDGSRSAVRLARRRRRALVAARAAVVPRAGAVPCGRSARARPPCRRRRCAGT